MRKKIIVSLVGLFLGLLFVSWQLYEYNKFQGNTILAIGNQSLNIDTVQIDVYLDGTKIFSDNLKRSWHIGKSIRLKTFFGKHRLLIKSNEFNIKKEYVFHTIIMKWIYIDFYEDVSRPLKNSCRYGLRVTTSPFQLAIE